MTNFLFSFLHVFEDNIWDLFGFPIIVLLGLYFTITSRFVQVRRFPEAVRNFMDFLFKSDASDGVHPIKAFFACIGGSIGIGNIVAVCTAIQVGGPGALFWVWLTATLGMTLKYVEVYLGMRYRVRNPDGGYSGGPMYYLQRAFKARWIPSFVAFLLVIYGVEIYQFSIVTHSIADNFSLNTFAVAFILLTFVIYAANGGVQRVGDISTAIVPIFIGVYLCMGIWVLFLNIHALPGLIASIVHDAFNGTAAVGGFIGSTFLVTMSQGIRRGCYTTDVGVGYASVIYSESRAAIPEKQSSLSFVDVFLDTFVVCTISVLIIIVTDVWHQPMHESMLVQSALAKYFPYMNYFMPIFLFLLGYTTIIAYFAVGLKCAQYLAPAYGKTAFFSFAAFFLMAFTFFSSAEAIVVMSIVQAILLILNVIGFYKLRRDISYHVEAPTREETLIEVES